MMFYLSLIPTWLLQGVAIIAAIGGLSTVYAVTRSLQATSIVTLVAVLAGGGWFYRDTMIAQGRMACEANVKTASVQVVETVKTVVIDHSAADKQRIADLELANAKLTTQVGQREEKRAATPLSDPCEQCRVPRSWMRGSP
jgi:hypothetical protein